jgi:hypothetical protein
MYLPRHTPKSASSGPWRGQTSYIQLDRRTLVMWRGSAADDPWVVLSWQVTSGSATGWANRVDTCTLPDATSPQNGATSQSQFSVAVLPQSTHSRRRRKIAFVTLFVVVCITSNSSMATWQHVNRQINSVAGLEKEEEPGLPRDGTDFCKPLWPRWNSSSWFYNDFQEVDVSIAPIIEINSKLPEIP